MSDLSIEDVIIGSMPFSDELIDWCNKTPEFKEALKVIYPERFLTLQAISTTYSPNVPQDQVIGIFAYDRKLKKFKQDFIINKNEEGKEFILYTKLPGKDPKYNRYIKHINEFFATYAKGGHYKGTHHIEFENLPGKEIKSRARKVIKLAERLDRTGLRVLTDEELIDIHTKIQKAKRLSKKDTSL